MRFGWGAGQSLAKTRVGIHYRYVWKRTDARIKGMLVNGFVGMA